MRGENIIAVVLVIVLLGVVGLFTTSPVGMFSSVSKQACYDSDGGNNIYEKGWTEHTEMRLHPDDVCDEYEGTDSFWECARNNIKVVTVKDTDHCIDDSTLIELFCNENKLGVGEANTCPKGCQDGRCLA